MILGRKKNAESMVQIQMYWYLWNPKGLLCRNGTTKNHYDKWMPHSNLNIRHLHERSLWQHIHISRVTLFLFLYIYIYNLNFALAYDLLIANTMFKKRESHRVSLRPNETDLCRLQNLIKYTVTIRKYSAV